MYAIYKYPNSTYVHVHVLCSSLVKILQCTCTCMQAFRKCVPYSLNKTFYTTTQRATFFLPTCPTLMTDDEERRSKYSQKLLWVKNFTNLAALPPSKMFFHAFLWGERVVGPIPHLRLAIHKSFHCKMLYFCHFVKVFTPKSFCL